MNTVPDKNEDMLDIVLSYYMEKFSNTNVPEYEMRKIKTVIKGDVLKNAFPLIEKNLLDEAREKAAKEKRKMLDRFEFSLIIETVIVAACVGFIVNQATSLLHPCTAVGWIFAFIVPITICILVIYIKVFYHKE